MSRRRPSKLGLMQVKGYFDSSSTRTERLEANVEQALADTVKSVAWTASSAAATGVDSSQFYLCRQLKVFQVVGCSKIPKAAKLEEWKKKTTQTAVIDAMHSLLACNVQQCDSAKHSLLSARKPGIVARTRRSLSAVANLWKLSPTSAATPIHAAAKRKATHKREARCPRVWSSTCFVDRGCGSVVQGLRARAECWSTSLLETLLGRTTSPDIKASQVCVSSSLMTCSRSKMQSVKATRASSFQPSTYTQGTVA